MTFQRGFTLLELVLVLVLTGILAAVALPRLSLSSSFDERLQADNLVGLLRLAQLRAMNDPGALQASTDVSRCGRLVITSTGFSLSEDCNSTTLLNGIALNNADSQGLFLGKTGIAIGAGHSLPLVLQFGRPAQDPRFLSSDSRLGRPFLHQSGAAAVALTTPLEIIIGGKTVRIETEGYIHAP
ncbi:prepilin-type N-terminal cleavage/methylation domain-containing protein [Zobellella iuensis]|uniref:Prepilin-type N-terminal cleavage/methylation domain-containing protein n=1 Tax=Zobellella iuensis TaxID=2803811 RepID=A0ABS1QRW5_9GAMM|nr:prepilin-type N-terminal cleavage/methylation domain-containing protein [Zobellella iuensis]MBL1377206.1 prepilin-type N-terminal cleavage/methylation domain-containing protein [Zobellella iuensis]